MVRVAIDQLGSTEPSAGDALRRFSPVRDQNSRRVPVLYAGADLPCALGETVFHDLPDDVTVPAEVFRADLIALRAGTFEVTATIQVADLTEAALDGYGWRRAEVVDTSPVEDATTRLWGQHVWNTTTCAGITWNSRRSPDRLAYMLFVNPPRPADRSRAVNRKRDLKVVLPPLALYDGDGLTAVMSAAAERNVTVII